MRALLDSSNIIHSYVATICDWGDACLSVYNMQVYDYESFTQYRIYGRPVVSGKKKSDIDLQGEQTEKQRVHSQYVSINRTKQSIYEFAYNNKWDLFITLTFDSNKTDRYDYDNIVKKTTKWLNNVRSRQCPDLMYLIVPEMHKDGAFHVHGLLAHCDGLELVDSGRVAIGKNACFRNQANQHYPWIYNISNWKWGFSMATKVVDNGRCCSYICKYVTKDLCVKLKGKRRFLQSRNCKRVEVEQYNWDCEDIDTMLEEFYRDGLVDYDKTLDVPVAGQRVRFVTVKKCLSKSDE